MHKQPEKSNLLKNIKIHEEIICWYSPLPLLFPERKARNQEGYWKGRDGENADRREERRASVLESDQWSFEEHLRVMTKDRYFEWEKYERVMSLQWEIDNCVRTRDMKAVTKIRANFQGMPGRGRGKPHRKHRQERDLNAPMSVTVGRILSVRMRTKRMLQHSRLKWCLWQIWFNESF